MMHRKRIKNKVKYKVDAYTKCGQLFTFDFDFETGDIVGASRKARELYDQEYGNYSLKRIDVKPKFD